MDDTQEILPPLHTTDAGGEPRRLDPLHMTLAAPKGYFRTWASQPNPPVVPRSEWKEIDFSAHIGPVTDQDGVGECNCATTVEIVMGQRSIEGLSYVALSAGDLYARINGGSDQGSLPEDALKELTDNGVATTATVPFCDWRHQHAGAAAERPLYRITEAHYVETVDELCSALQQGFFANLCMAWSDGDSNPDSQGRLPARTSGSVGGHSITACGMKKFGSDWYILIRNHWTATWGLNGCAYLPIARLDADISQFRMWACRQSVQGPSGIPTPQP